MATVRDILSRKGTEVVSVPPTATVLEAARRMWTKMPGTD